MKLLNIAKKKRESRFIQSLIMLLSAFENVVKFEYDYLKIFIKI